MGKVIVLGANKGYSKRGTIKVCGAEALNICRNIVADSETWRRCYLLNRLRKGNSSTIDGLENRMDYRII